MDGNFQQETDWLRGVMILFWNWLVGVFDLPLKWIDSMLCWAIFRYWINRLLSWNLREVMYGKKDSPSLSLMLLRRPIDPRNRCLLGFHSVVIPGRKFRRSNSLCFCLNRWSSAVHPLFLYSLFISRNWQYATAGALRFQSPELKFSCICGWWGQFLAKCNCG